MLLTKQSPAGGSAFKAKRFGLTHSFKTNFDPFMDAKLDRQN
jgi:hypothetical protein